MSQPQRNADNDPIASDILQWLSTTDYACSALKRLDGGILNFVYRGTLCQPLSDGATTIILKHAEEKMPGLEGYTLSTSRNHFEAEMMRRLPESVARYHIDGVDVVVPKTYRLQIPASVNTQAFEDFQSQLTLRDVLLMRTHELQLSAELAVRLGSALGNWVSRLHIWGGQANYRSNSIEGKAMEEQSIQEASFDFYYNNPLQKVTAFHDVLGGCEDIFNWIKLQAASDLTASPSKAMFGFIHGDLSTKNILIQADQQLRTFAPCLIIIDWELSQFNSQLRDIGQVLADLFLLKYFAGVEVAVSFMHGFLQGSGCFQPNDIASLSIHVGLHLLLFDITLPGPYPTWQKNNLVALARDLIVFGWNRDLTKLQQTGFWTLL